MLGVAENATISRRRFVFFFFFSVVAEKWLDRLIWGVKCNYVM